MPRKGVPSTGTDPAVLLAGQEKKLVPGATHASCTIEMTNMLRRVDVAVVDEVQVRSPLPPSACNQLYACRGCAPKVPPGSACVQSASEVPPEWPRCWSLGALVQLPPGCVHSCAEHVDVALCPRLLNACKCLF